MIERKSGKEKDKQGKKDGERTATEKARQPKKDK